MSAAVEDTTPEDDVALYVLSETIDEEAAALTAIPEDSANSMDMATVSQELPTFHLESEQTMAMLQPPPATLDACTGSIDRDVHQMAPVPLGPLDAQPHAERYILFTLAGNQYAVPAPYVREIGSLPRITPVPNVPAWVRGVINLRGDILSVIDLRILLGLEDMHHDEHRRMLVVKTPGDAITASFIVDQILDIVPLAKARLDSPMTLPGSLTAPYLIGPYEYNGQVCAVFDLERLLTAATPQRSLTAIQDTMRPTVTPRADVLRVPRGRVDELVRLVSDLVMSRTAYEQHLGGLMQQVEALRLSIERLQRTTMTVETQYEVCTLAASQDLLTPHIAVAGDSTRVATPSTTTQECAVLEYEHNNELKPVARELTETTADITALGQAFNDIVEDFDGYLTHQRRLTSGLQDKLTQLRMVPLATLAPRLHRTVRVTARQQGKEAILQIEDEAIKFDKTILEGMAEPLFHLLRNAVDYGIEPPEVRQQLGKPQQGQLHLRVCREGTRVVLQLHDDGASLDPERLRAMDVVQAMVSRLKGYVTIDDAPGQGVTCTMHLPLAPAITRVLLVKAHGETLAIPLADVTQIGRLAPQALEHVDGVPVMRLDTHLLPVWHLGERLHLPQVGDSTAHLLPIIVVQAGDTRVAFMVDELIGGREVVVTTLGSHLHCVHGVVGSTLLGDGTVGLILNPAELIRDEQRQVTAPAA